MQFQEPVRQGEFLKRYKRFFADIRYNEEVIVAHVPNTGSLKSCLFENAPCIWTESQNPARKLKGTLQFLQTPDGWVGVNTSITNDLVHEAWSQKRIPDWHPFTQAKREVKLSPETRIDLVLAPNETALAEGRDLTYVEVKNVSYFENGVARFPDAVTVRGQKHLQELMKLKSKGFGAETVFVIQREKCRAFAPADAIDPEYGRLLRQAAEQGVKLRAFACEIDPKTGVSLSATPVPIEL